MEFVTLLRLVGVMNLIIHSVQSVFKEENPTKVISRPPPLPQPRRPPPHPHKKTHKKTKTNKHTHTHTNPNNFNVDFPSDMYRRTTSKLSMVTDTGKVYILVPVLMTVTFI